MPLSKPALGVLLIIVTCIGAGVVVGLNQPKSSSTSQSSSIQKALKTPEEDTILVKTSLTSISSALEKQDIELFRTYVDSKALCNSVYDLIYASLESYLPKGVFNRDKVVVDCQKDMMQYVTDKNQRKNNESGSIFIGIEELFSEQSKPTINRSEATLTALFMVDGTPTSFTFKDTGTVAQLVGFSAKLQATK